MAKTVYIRDFPEDLHRDLRVKAAYEDIPIRELIIRYCQEGLERDKKKNEKQ